MGDVAPACLRSDGRALAMKRICLCLVCLCKALCVEVRSQASAKNNVAHQDRNKQCTTILHETAGAARSRKKSAMSVWGCTLPEAARACSPSSVAPPTLRKIVHLANLRA